MQEGPIFFLLGFVEGRDFLLLLLFPMCSHLIPIEILIGSHQGLKVFPKTFSIALHSYPIYFDIKLRNTPFKKNTHTHTQTRTNLWVPIPINRINNMCPQFIVLATYWLLTRLSSWLLITYHLVIDFFDNQLNWYSFGIEFSKL